MNFFINRPIFAAAIALMMVLAGGICMVLLPVSQFPPMAPPQVQVTSTYIGASGAVVSGAVTEPIEEQINGVEGMIYMSSNSTNAGQSLITVTFETGYDQSIAEVDVQNRADRAKPQLPTDVAQYGVTVDKVSQNLMLVVNLTSPDGTYDGQFLGNYADIHVVDALARIPGIASIINFGLRKYAIRVWLDPRKLTNLGLTPSDVVNAIKEQNQQVAAGSLGGAPAPADQAFTYQLDALGRLDQVSQFEDIVLRASTDGSIVRVSDVARVELGSESYNSSFRLSGKPAAALGIFQLPDANGFTIANAVREELATLSGFFPADVSYEIPYDTTRFVRASIKEVLQALFLAMALVFLVVYVFLQDLRGTLIPGAAIPVSLIGTFAFMAAFGFSINILSLLGLVLAVGLVVDDAIVVVENVQRRIQEGAVDLHQATRDAMAEVRGPIVATTLALLAVFVPVAFIPGLVGKLYNQFALTIAIAVGLSGINSMTMSPAFCALLLRPARTGPKNAFFRGFDWLFGKTTDAYVTGVHVLARLWYVVLIVFIGVCMLVVLLIKDVPKGFVPAEDQGYVIVGVFMPRGAAIGRTEAVMADVTRIALATKGVATVEAVSGYNFLDGINQVGSGAAWVILEPWDERGSADLQVDGIIKKLQERLDVIPAARVIVLNAPPIPGLALAAGLNLEIQDRDAHGTRDLALVAENYLKQLNERPELARAFSTFSDDTPMRFLDIDRTKAKALGVSLTDLFDTLQINLGSLYVNDFNKFGRTYRVYVQADEDSRTTPEDISNLRVRNDQGQMIDLGVLVTVKPQVGAYNVTHYNLYGSVSINGIPSPEFSTGQAVRAMEEVARTLPEGFSHEWTGTVFQQLKAGDLAPSIFVLSVIFVFLVLAAQYESWSLPFMVLMAVPLGILGALTALLLRGLNLDVYGQIGLVMLIGLTAKNAILIVAFAKEHRDKGATVLEAATTAARLRLRPILMTAFAFIFGVLPLVLATGAGANSRHSMGTTVMGGMLVSTVLIIMVPVFYYMIESLRERTMRRRGRDG
jgi:HAE1 family hydrophobic/amphiphilic exporter-1